MTSKKKRILSYNEPLLALQNFKAGQYGLLIIDVGMPVIDGFRLYQQLKQIDSKPKVFFATAFSLHYDALRRYFPIEDENNEIEEILGGTCGHFIRKLEKLEEAGLVNKNLSGAAKQIRLKGLINRITITGRLDNRLVEAEHKGRQSNVIITTQRQSMLKIFVD